MKKHDLLDFDMEEFTAEIKKIIQDTRDQAREVNMGDGYSLFDDVYDTPTPNIVEQRAELAEHLKEYGDWYDNLDQWDL